jgi:hypothetical protein
MDSPLPTDITAWLEGVGLGKYLQLFAEQEIDTSVPPDLTDADLEKIGLPLGPRKKILRAIAQDALAAVGR